MFVAYLFMRFFERKLSSVPLRASIAARSPGTHQVTSGTSAPALSRARAMSAAQSQALGRGKPEDAGSKSKACLTTSGMWRM